MSRRFAAAVAASVVLGAALVAGAGAIPAVPRLPPGWSHAEINVIVKGTSHTLIYDSGRVTAVSATSLTLKERDGTVWVINVSPATQITIDGQAAPITEVRPLETAVTLIVDGGDATNVTVRIPPALAAAIAAAEARQQARAARQAARQARKHGGA
jgi:hypothetical protein